MEKNPQRNSTRHRILRAFRNPALNMYIHAASEHIPHVTFRIPSRSVRCVFSSRLTLRSCTLRSVFTRAPSFVCALHFSVAFPAFPTRSTFRHGDVPSSTLHTFLRSGSIVFRANQCAHNVRIVRIAWLSFVVRHTQTPSSTTLFLYLSRSLALSHSLHNVAAHVSFRRLLRSRSFRLDIRKPFPLFGADAPKPMRPGRAATASQPHLLLSHAVASCVR